MTTIASFPGLSPRLLSLAVCRFAYTASDKSRGGAGYEANPDSHSQSPELVARLEKIKMHVEQQEYDRMVKNVNPNVR